MMATEAADLEAQLRALEERLLDPQVRASPQALGQLLADEFVELGSSGRVWDKQGVLAALPGESGVRYSLENLRARRLAPDVALVTYRATRTELPAGRESHSLRSSIWQFRDGRWQMVFHQGTPTGA